jgi:hypothetical protein
MDVCGYGGDRMHGGSVEAIESVYGFIYRLLPPQAEQEIFVRINAGFLKSLVFCASEVAVGKRDRAKAVQI